MSISQNLVTSQLDLDLFAPSWQAGLSRSQCLTNSLRKYDIESVNVAKTCEKLNLAVNKNSKSGCEMFQDGNDDENQCAAMKSCIPFRASSNIWYGTLKIYQQQVNTLLHLSRDLLLSTCSYDVKKLETIKRKSSLASKKNCKKRRLTLSESKERTYFTTNYSELLDDLKKLTQEPLQQSLAEFSQSAVGGKTQVQIREITIREISATIYSPPDLIDEDSGFGEATHEEITQFLNFVEDNSMCSGKKTPTKRKSIRGKASPIKKNCYINDYAIDNPLSNENSPLTENIIKTSSIVPANNAIAFDENNADNILQHNCDIVTKEIKKEKLNFIQNECIPKMFIAKKKKKIIIDECTKIDILEIMDDMKTFEGLELPRRKILRLYKTARKIAALELLTNFNRRSLNLTLSLKRKFVLSQHQFEQDYLNLLRDIFKINYKEEWASEIYPQWIFFKDDFKKQKVYKSRKQPKIVNHLETDDNNINEPFNTKTMEEDENHLEYQQSRTMSGYNEMKMISSCVYNEWRPHGVMEKLFNLWRFNQTNKIASITLFKLAENQIDKALGFNSLLHLAKSQFVSLTRFPKSIELKNILMGKAIK